MRKIFLAAIFADVFCRIIIGCQLCDDEKNFVPIAKHFLGKDKEVVQQLPLFLTRLSQRLHFAVKIHLQETKGAHSIFTVGNTLQIFLQYPQQRFSLSLSIGRKAACFSALCQFVCLCISQLLQYFSGSLSCLDRLHAELLQHLHQLFQDLLSINHLSDLPGHTIQKQTNQGKSFIKACCSGPLLNLLIGNARQNIIHLIITAIFIEQIIIRGKASGNLLIL